MRTLLATVCFLTLSAVQGKAQLNVKQYRERLASKDADRVLVTKMYIRGLAEGMVWANLRAENLWKKRLFCQPDNLGINLDNFIDILDGQIKTDSSRLTETKLEETEIGLFLMAGLEKTFPCTGK